MKYILQILLMTIVIIPVLLVDCFRALWDFDIAVLKQSRDMYTRAVQSNWNKLRGVKRPTRF